MTALLVSLMWMAVVSTYAVQVARRSREQIRKDALPTVSKRETFMTPLDPREFSLFIEKVTPELNDSYLRAWKNKLIASENIENHAKAQPYQEFIRQIEIQDSAPRTDSGSMDTVQDAEDSNSGIRSSFPKTQLWTKTVH